MKSTYLTRTGRRLAAAGIIGGMSMLGCSAAASAEGNMQLYGQCVRDGGDWVLCCARYLGNPTTDAAGSQICTWGKDVAASPDGSPLPTTKPTITVPLAPGNNSVG